MTPPTHLQTNDLVEDKIFDESEKIFKRFVIRTTKIAGDIFSTIPTKQWIDGTSANREKYSPNPIDELWRIFYEDDKCQYDLKTNHEVRYVEYGFLSMGKIKLEIEIICIHKPEKCNKSHCDLYFNPLLSTLDDNVNIRLLMGTLFKPTGIKN